MLTSFRFWGAEKEIDERFGPGHCSMQAPVALSQPTQSISATKPRALPTTGSARPPKRQLDSGLSPDASDEVDEVSPSKRVKVNASALESAVPPMATLPDVRNADFSAGSPAAASATSSDVEQARDAIHYQFGLEILLKHDELRLINQELAKCQVALEQLRRCHLIPYPTACPTPEQMMGISSGQGPAVQNRAGEVVPQWAPPFGVVDGPYARHYAKWLIPDPKFDGMQPEYQPVMEATGRGRASAEGRTTRNSIVDLGAAPKPRRGLASQKLQSLSTGYSQPKDKAGPCVLKRSDGQTVKLVCIDCHRENFSSTQGFINHCRIAHRRDFKSHEEAAVHSGHPLDVSDQPAPPSVPEKVREKERPAAVSTPALSVPSPAPSGLVHPFANAQITEQQTYTALQSRIAASLELYRKGKLPGVTNIPGASSASDESTSSRASTALPKKSSFVSDDSTPFLSKLMQKRGFEGSLADMVKDAKTRISLDMFTPGEESDDVDAAPVGETPTTTRPPVVMRVPARVATSSVAPAAGTATPTARPISRKGVSPHLGFASPPLSLSDKDEAECRMLRDVDVEMEDADLSPNTIVSNNAPSLVSDDGEYDDSDDASSVTDATDGLDAGSVSDVAEINIDEEHDPRPIRHHRTSTSVGNAMHLKQQDDGKHVTFINPVKNNSKRARKV